MLVVVNVLVCSIFVDAFVLVAVNRCNMCSMMFVCASLGVIFGCINRSAFLPLERCIVLREFLLCYK